MKPLSLFIILSFISIIGRSQHIAGFQPFNLAMNLSYDIRLPALMFKPSINLNLLRDRIHLSGQYCIQLKKLEDWDKEVLQPEKSLIGNNIDRAYNAYEWQVGFNYFKHTQEGVLIRTVRKSFNWTFYGLEPGSRAYLLGVHSGLGGYRSKIGIYDHPFDLKDPYGKIYNEANSSTFNGYYSYHTYANTITEYFFAGIHNQICKKLDINNDVRRGGIVVNIYSDVLVPTRMSIGKMYSSINEEFTAVPKEGDNWKKMGYRVGFSRKATGLLSLNMKFEIGVMPVFSTYGKGPKTTYFSIELGLGIGAKINKSDSF